MFQCILKNKILIRQCVLNSSHSMVPSANQTGSFNHKSKIAPKRLCFIYSDFDSVDVIEIVFLHSKISWECNVKVFSRVCSMYGRFLVFENPLFFGFRIVQSIS